jgi:hypothetical protein
MFRWALVALASVAFATEAISQSPPARAHSIALVTVGPGRAPITWFGHSALLVDDGSAGGARIYGYGGVPFAWRTLVGAVRGRMTTSATARDAIAELARIEKEGRSIRIQWLAIDARAAAALALTLQLQSGSDPLRYTYDALTDNCATRVRDLIDVATGGRLRATLTALPAPRSLREEGMAALGAHPIRAMLVDFVASPAADARASLWEASAIPTELANAVPGALVTADSTRPPPVSVSAAAMTWPAATLLLVVALIGLAVRAHRRRNRPVVPAIRVSAARPARPSLHQVPLS